VSEPLPSAKHEKFCLGIVLEGLSVTDSYAACGYVRNRQNAWKLRRRDYIERRIKALLEEQAHISRTAVVQAIAEKKVTTESLLEELDESRILGKQKEDPRAMTQASLGKARLAGLMVEKVNMSVQTDDVSQKTPEELRDAITDSLLEWGEKLALDLETALFVDFVEALYASMTDEIDPPELDPTRGRRMPWDPRPQYLSGPPKRPRPKIIDGQVIVPEAPPRPEPRQLSAPARPVDWMPKPRPVVDPKARKPNGIPADAHSYDNRRRECFPLPIWSSWSPRTLTRPGHPRCSRSGFWLRCRWSR
jgi:hypothetical protein